VRALSAGGVLQRAVPEGALEGTQEVLQEGVSELCVDADVGHEMARRMVLVALLAMLNKKHVGMKVIRVGRHFMNENKNYGRNHNKSQTQSVVRTPPPHHTVP
jgi:hypothetical protein